MNSISGAQSIHIGPETTAELVGGDIHRAEMWLVAEGQIVGRALHGHEGHRKEGILMERSKYLCLRNPSLPTLKSWALLVSTETRCHLSKLGHLSSTSHHFLEDFSRVRVWLGETRVDDFVQITAPRTGPKAISEP